MKGIYLLQRLYNQRYKISLRPATSDSVGPSNWYLCLARKPNLIRAKANRKVNTHITTSVSLTHFAEQNFTNFPVKS